MHDFIQLQSFSLSRAPFVVRPAPAEWVQRGIMRSFGEDEVAAPYRSSPRPAGRSSRKSKAPNRK
jgi:hypothetical protein